MDNVITFPVHKAKSRRMKDSYDDTYFVKRKMDALSDDQVADLEPTIVRQLDLPQDWTVSVNTLGVFIFKHQGKQLQRSWWVAKNYKVAVHIWDYDEDTHTTEHALELRYEGGGFERHYLGEGQHVTAAIATELNTLQDLRDARGSL